MSSRINNLKISVYIMGQNKSWKIKNIKNKIFVERLSI